MEYVLKIYSNQNSTLPFNTIENLNNIDINWDLNDFSLMKLDLPINILWLSQFNKVELCTTDNGVDTVEFWGYIHSIKPSLWKISLECRDYKALLLKKLVLADKHFAGDTPATAINAILQDWLSATNEGRNFSTTYTWTFNKDISEWDNWFDVLDEIWDLCWCVWNVSWNTIYFEQIIGIDRSLPASPLFFELVYNGNDLTENSIDTVTTETYWTLANFVIWKSGAWKVQVQDNPSIIALWVFAEYKNFRDWDLTAQTNQYLTLKKNEQKIFKINWRKGIWNDVNIWDKIHLRIENLNPYMDIITDVFVLQKSVSIENGTKIVMLTLAEIYATIDTLQKKLNNITKQLNLLSL